MGVMKDFKQTAGRILFSKQNAKNNAREYESSSQQFLKKSGGISSGPLSF
jgi:hypothetical protein